MTKGIMFGANEHNGSLVILTDFQCPTTTQWSLPSAGAVNPT